MDQAANLTPNKVKALSTATLKQLATYLGAARDGVFEELAARERIAQKQGGSVMRHAATVARRQKSPWEA